MKLRDRFMVGAIAGVSANVFKHIWAGVARKATWLTVDGPEKAGGMILQANDLARPLGRVIGYASDSVMAGASGIAITYALSLTGPGAAPIKGALIGDAIWTFAYGSMAALGATSVKTVTPKNALADMLGHTLFGALAAYIVTKIADPGLFDGTIPLDSIKPKGGAGEGMGQRLHAKRRRFRIAARRCPA